MVTATDSWSGALTVDVEGWPGDYNINPEACIPIITRSSCCFPGDLSCDCENSASARAENAAIADGLDDLLDGLPTWTH